MYFQFLLTDVADCFDKGKRNMFSGVWIRIFLVTCLFNLTGLILFLLLSINKTNSVLVLAVDGL
jgi:hypothetical protein